MTNSTENPANQFQAKAAVLRDAISQHLNEARASNSAIEVGRMLPMIFSLIDLQREGWTLVQKIHEENIVLRERNAESVQAS